MENETEVPEVVPTETTEQTPEVPSESSPEPQPEAAKPDDELIPRKRLDKVVWQREEALRKAARLEEENMRLKTSRETPKQEAEDHTKPRPDQFDTFDKYTEALTEWKVESRIQKAQQDYQKRTEQERFLSSKKAFEERAEKVREKFPDYDELFDSAPISEAMAPTILESEQGPELAVYLAKNPDVARKIYNLSPTQAARELGKIEAKLDDLLKPVSVTNATPPLQPAKPKGGVPDGLDDALDINTWMKRRNKQLGR